MVPLGKLTMKTFRFFFVLFIRLRKFYKWHAKELEFHGTFFSLWFWNLKKRQLNEFVEIAHLCSDERRIAHRGIAEKKCESQVIITQVLFKLWGKKYGAQARSLTLSLTKLMKHWFQLKMLSFFRTHTFFLCQCWIKFLKKRRSES